MKARVKATGEIWEFSQIDEITFKSAINGHLYCAEELEFLEPSVFTPDYWTRLEHQAAIAAMQGILSNQDYCELLIENNEGSFAEDVSRCASEFAHALVEKYKKEERK